MKYLPASILFVMYTLLIILMTSEFFVYQDSLGSQTHFVIYFLTLLAFILTGLGYVTYRFGMRILSWVMIILGVAVGLYVGVLHVNEIKVIDRGHKEMQMQVYNMQQQNNPHKQS